MIELIVCLIICVISSVSKGDWSLVEAILKFVLGVGAFILFATLLTSGAGIVILILLVLVLIGVCTSNN